MGMKAVLHGGYRFKDRRIIALCTLVDRLLGLVPWPERPFPSRVGKVLVIKPDHLGDMLMLTAVLPLIRGRYPEARIEVLCHELSAAILRHNPRIDGIIPFTHLLYNRARLPWLVKLGRFVRDSCRLAGRLRREKYDLCLNFRDAGGDLILLARLVGCRFLVGHGTGGFAPLLDRVAVWRSGVHEVEHYLEVLRPLGITAPLAELRYELYPDAADEARVAALCAAHGLTAFSVIHPGSGDPRKLVPAARWAEIIAGIPAGTAIVFTGSREEAALHGAVAPLTGRKTVSLMGELTIGQLFLLFRRATRIYTVDSLSAHLAAMTGVETLVFWSGINDPAQWRPLGSRVTIETGSVGGGPQS